MGLVQSKSGDTASSSSLTLTLTSNTTAGNTLVVMFGASGGEVPTGVTLGGSATGWTNPQGGTWINQNIAGGQTSIVISFSGTGGFAGAFAFEWSGLATSGGVDKKNATVGSGNSWTSGTTGTLTQANEVAFGFGEADSNGATPTITGPVSGFTNLTPLSGFGGIDSGAIIAGYQQVSATTALTYAGTCTNATLDNVGEIITLKLAGNINVNLPLIQVNINVPAVLPPAVSVALPVINVSVNVPGVTPVIPQELIIAIASIGGIDPLLGENYLAGVNNFKGTTPADFVNLLNSSLNFFSTGTVNAGGLINVAAGNVELVSGQAGVGDAEGGVFVVSGIANSTPGQGLVDIVANLVQVNGVNWLGHAPPSNLSNTASGTQIATAVNALIATLVTLGVYT